MIVTIYYDSNNNEYYVDNGVLYISAGASGTGAMQNFTSSSTVRTLVGEDFTSVVMAEGMTKIGNYAFYNNTTLTDITMPSGLTSIGNGAFQGCTSLALTSLPGGVTSIGNYAFKGSTSLTSVTIPSSVTSIGHGAFQDCTNLTKIFMLGTTPATVGINTFPSDTIISVPNSALDAYKSAWSAYANQIVALSTNSAKIKINGVWKSGTPYVKVNGVWKKGEMYVNVNGTWKKGSG